MDGRIPEVGYSHPRYARGTLASTLVYATQYARVRYKYATSTLPYFNFFLTGTVSQKLEDVDKQTLVK